jgi:hypothetical protein
MPFFFLIIFYGFSSIKSENKRVEQVLSKCKINFKKLKKQNENITMNIQSSTNNWIHNTDVQLVVSDYK